MLSIHILTGLLQLVVLKNTYLDTSRASTADSQVVAYQSSQVLTVLTRSVLVVVKMQVYLVLVHRGVHRRVEHHGGWHWGWWWRVPLTH